MRIPSFLRNKHLGLLVIAVGVITGYYLISRLIPHENLQKILDDVSNALGAWTYLLVGVLAFLETGAFVGLVVPGETVMLLGGAVAGQGAIDIYLLIAIGWFAAWLGDTTSFFIGRRLGRGFVLRHGPRVGISEERFERVEDYFSRHGGKTILVGRFISLVRALAPFVAGSSGMRYRAFVPYSILGTGIWASAHILIGYFFSRSIDTAAEYAGRGAFILGTLIVLTVGSVLAYSFFRIPENRRRAVEWMEEHPATARLPPLGRRLEPQARFLWNRLTPGGTFGLEFTSTLAVLAIGLFVLVAYTVIVDGDAGPTPGDVTAQDIVDSIQTGWLTTVAKGITALGSPVVVWTLAFGCAAALAMARRWWEFWVLVGGMALIIVALHVFKEAVDRPRPEGGLVSVQGSSFPSAHAAYSTFYVWLAVTTVMRLRPGMARGTGVVLGGIGLAGLIGLSRAYLGVHYLSDVSAGWALGASAFALCAGIALIVAQLRQNPSEVAASPTATAQTES
jgi:membrane protein DedA with SNARE-associated domain/membrane-associated phospholipid phosphatase